MNNSDAMVSFVSRFDIAIEIKETIFIYYFISVAEQELIFHLIHSKTLNKFRKDYPNSLEPTTIKEQTRVRKNG